MPRSLSVDADVNLACNQRPPWVSARAAFSFAKRQPVHRLLRVIRRQVGVDHGGLDGGMRSNSCREDPETGQSDRRWNLTPHEQRVY